MSTPTDALKALLAQRLTSLEHIAVVLLLRSDRGRSWTAPEVAGALATAPETAAMRLFLLASGGLIAFEPSSVPRYRYTGEDEASDALLEELESLMRSNPGAVGAIVDAPRDPLRSFSDAFRLKR